MIKKFKIFLSCGQIGNEKKDGLHIKKYIEEQYPDEISVFFAETTYTTEGLTNIIYKELLSCDAFIGILHDRYKLDGKENEYQSSLFVNQELAIASYLGKKYFKTYSKPNVINEGVNKFILNNNIIFDDIEIIIKDIDTMLKEWLKIWKPINELIDTEVIIKNYEVINEGFNSYDVVITITNNSTNTIENLWIFCIVPTEIFFRNVPNDNRILLNKYLSRFIRCKDTHIRLTQIPLTIHPKIFKDQQLIIQWNTNKTFINGQFVILIIYENIEYFYKIFWNQDETAFKVEQINEPIEIFALIREKS